MRVNATTRPRVLLVDDEPAILDLLGELFAGWGYVTEAATSGEQALALVQRRAFDLAVLDIRMPGLDGLELLRRLKVHDAGIEVLMLTGNPSADSAVQALRDGAFGYIAKPVDPDELRHSASSAIERRALREEVRSLRSQLGQVPAPTELSFAAAERSLIAQVLRIHGNDREKAARALGISPRTMYRRLAKYGLSRKRSGRWGATTGPPKPPDARGAPA